MTVPLTRDLREVLSALDIVTAELGFQAERLRARVLPDSDTARAYLTQLGHDYEHAQRTCEKLRQYHAARVRRAALPPTPDDHDPNAVDGRGTAAPSLE